MLTELTPLEKASKAYPDLWDRYLNLLFGYIPENIIITEAQAERFIALTQLEEFQ